MLTTNKFAVLIRDVANENIRIDFLDKESKRVKLKLYSGNRTVTVNNNVTYCRLSHLIDKSRFNKAYTVMLCRIIIGGVTIDIPIEIKSIFSITGNTVVRKNEIIGDYRLARDGRIFKLITEKEYCEAIKVNSNRKHSRAFRYTPGVYYRDNKSSLQGGIYVSPLYDISTKIYGKRSPDDRVNQWVGFKLADNPQRYEIFIPSEAYELGGKDLTFASVTKYMYDNGYITEHNRMKYVFTDKFFSEWVKPEKVLLDIKGTVAKDGALRDLEEFLRNIMKNTIESIPSGGVNGVANEMLIPALRIGAEIPKIEANTIDTGVMVSIQKSQPEWFKWIPAKTKSWLV